VKRKILIFVIVIVLIMGIIIALGNNKSEQSSKAKIVTSFYPMYIATLNIVEGIDSIDVQNLTANSTGCVHDYTLTPEEMMKISNAKAVIINGSGMEGFLQDVINNYSNLKIIDTANGVLELKEEKHGINPHTFVSIENHIIQVQNIYNELVNLFPEHIAKMTENKDRYVQELINLKEYGETKLNVFKDTKVVAMHNSFEYFAHDFELNSVAIIEHEEGALASATELAHIIEEIQKNDVKIIITEKDNSANTANAIAKETGAKIVEFNPGRTGEETHMAYINAYRANIEKIANVLGGEN